MSQLLIKDISQLGDIRSGNLETMLIQLQEIMVMYRSAIKEVNTKLEVLNDEFQYMQKRNPINHIQYRVKTPKSILEKLEKRGFPLTLESAQENLSDIAGIRVICPFLDDIYTVADLLTTQDDVTVLRVSDYIKEPKFNGYRSLHLIIEVPVFFSSGPKAVKVEIQIRTIAMDFWASLEHQLRYKAAESVPESIVADLKGCADVIAKTDQKMQKIQKQVKSLR